MTTPSLFRSALMSAGSFATTSLIVFATVAFAERWMYRNLGLGGAYIAWTLMFIVLGGLGFFHVLRGKWRSPRFFLVYTAAFILYAAGWVGAYFKLRGTAGEWVGSLAGTFLMVSVFALWFGSLRSLWKLWAILFVANSIGYFLGSWLNDTLHDARGMLAWGVAYGFFLGAGIGCVIHLSQESAE
jgi:hypothetical protein